MLTGEITFQCAEETYACAPATLVHVPRNTVPGFTYREGGGFMLELPSSDGQSAEMFTDVDAELDTDKADFSKA